MATLLGRASVPSRTLQTVLLPHRSPQHISHKSLLGRQRGGYVLFRLKGPQENGEEID